MSAQFFWKIMQNKSNIYMTNMLLLAKDAM